LVPTALLASHEAVNEGQCQHKQRLRALADGGIHQSFDPHRQFLRELELPTKRARETFGERRHAFLRRRARRLEPRRSNIVPSAAAVISR
jgi:hypothetical protein